MSWSVGAGLEGRGVMITGAAGGIGKAVAEAFGTTGAKVMAVDLDQRRVDEVVAGLEGSGHVGVAVDLRDVASHGALVRRARQDLGNLYALVNLAAVLRRRSSVDDVTEDDWDLQHDINLKAAFFLCRAAGDAMIEQDRGGRIITFSSQGWWTGGFGGSVAYAATKGGLTSMTRGLARTFGPHRITVNTVAPGQVRTPMLMNGLAPEVYESMTRQTPLGYVAEPEEIAGPVVFLASDHARYITGSTLNVSGGFLMYCDGPTHQPGAEDQPMIRVAFTMRLKPGTLPEYRRAHDAIWPELVAELQRSGIRSMTIFEDEPLLFVYSEVDDADAWERLWQSEVHQRWADVLAPFMQPGDGRVGESVPMREVSHIEPHVP